MCLRPLFIKDKVCACGKCFECLIAKSNEWAFRCCLEASLYKDNCFITLTYDNEHRKNELVKSDLQKFLKRLRKHIQPKKIRYFACGEYGKKFEREHFHIILFGFDFDDKWFFMKDKKGINLFRSPTLEKLWTFGFSSIGEVNIDTTKYCSKYLQKIPTSKKVPFVTMSKKPGIGYGAIKGSWLDSDKIYVNGKYIKIPRYFLDVLEKQDYNLFKIDRLKEQRLVNSKKVYMLYNNKYGCYEFHFPLYLEKIQERRKKFERIFGKRLDILNNKCYYKEKI